MLRSLLISLSKASWAKNMVTNWGFAWRAASRFVAGEKMEDAIRAVQGLNQRGINATLDLLGEHTTNTEESLRATQDILDIFNSIAQSGIRSNVSIKLTQIGLALSEDTCRQNLKRILECAASTGNYVRIDMESSKWVNVTLKLLREMRREQGYDNVGTVIQSYLYRSEEDVRQLIEECTSIRLCKGAYKEPAEIAYPAKADVDASFDLLARMMLDGALSSGCPAVSENGYFPPRPALATHDERRIEHALAYAESIGLPKRAMEFQMLFGIRRDLQDALAAQGYPVRVYVPYGTEWYPYYVRRLAERPANLWFFISNFFRK